MPGPVTFDDLLACAERELAQRKRVYPRLVAAGKMTQAKADYELRMMGEIVDHFAGVAAKERLL